LIRGQYLSLGALLFTFPAASRAPLHHLNRKSQLSVEYKLLVYKAILKPIWTYGVQLWGSASNSNIEILERFQSKMLRIITDAPRFLPNAVIKRDLKVLSVRQEVRNYSVTPTDWQNLYFEEHITTVG
jgi:hypothetical protein